MIIKPNNDQAVISWLFIPRDLYSQFHLSNSLIQLSPMISSETPITRFTKWSEAFAFTTRCVINARVTNVVIPHILDLYCVHHCSRTSVDTIKHPTRNPATRSHCIRLLWPHHIVYIRHKLMLYLWWPHQTMVVQSYPGSPIRQMPSHNMSNQVIIKKDSKHAMAENNKRVFSHILTGCALSDYDNMIGQNRPE